MDTEKELDSIYADMFSEELLDRLLELYRLDMERSGITAAQEDYDRGKAALELCLNAEQKRTLSEIEAASRRNIRRAMLFAFSRGSRAGFRAAFMPGAPAEDFLPSADALMTESGELRHPAYGAGRRHLRGLCDRLYAQLDDAAQEHLVSVDVLWDERLLGVFRLCFELGRRAGRDFMGFYEFS